MEARQLSLFDPRPASPPPSDPHVATTDVPRLGRQNAAILARLQRGPASSYQLSAFALKYTSRLSDLRKYGYTITCQRMQDDTHLYTLEQ
jgi:hypothetical protein